MTTYYACVCGESGTDTSTAVTDAAHPDAKHAKTCAGPLLTSTSPAALARMVAAVSCPQTCEQRLPHVGAAWENQTQETTSESTPDQRRWDADPGPRRPKETTDS